MFGAGGGSNPFGTKASSSKRSSTRGPSSTGPSVGLFGMPPPSPIGAPSSPQHAGFGGFPSTNPPPALFGAGGPFSQVRPPVSPSVPAPTFGAGAGGTGSSGSPLFGGQQAVSGGAPIFGQTQAISSAQPVASTAGSPLFNPTNLTGSNPLFGQPSTNSSSLFGQKTTSTSLFGQPTSPVFGPTPTTSSSIVQPTIGSSSSATVTTSNNPLFGKTLTTSAPVFGQSTTTTSVFDQSKPTAVFSQGTTTTSSVYNQGTTNSTSVFGQSTTTTTSSLFGQSSTSTGPFFGQSSQATAGLFEQGASSTATSSFTFVPPKTTPLTADAEPPPHLSGAGKALFKGASGVPAASRPNTPVFGDRGHSPEPAPLPATSLFGRVSKPGISIFGDNQRLPVDEAGQIDTKEAEEGELIEPEGDAKFREGSSAASIFGAQNVGSEEEANSAVFGSTKPSVKSRLGHPDGEETVFSKPKIARGGLFGRPDAVTGPEESPQLSETESEVSDGGGGGGRRRVERTVSKEELSTIKSIICEAVPDVVNKSPLLAKHFSKFGEVSKVYTNTKKKTAIVHFTDHKSAKLAKARGKSLNSQMAPMKISYSQSSPGSKSRIRRANSRSDVDDELEAMGGVQATDRPPLAKKKIFSITKALKISQPGTTGTTSHEQGGAKGAVAVEMSGQGTGELLALMKQQTSSDGDRWAVLEARDKLMRLRMPRSQTRSGQDIMDINLVGTCPDFCPEKERYSRSAKNQLRWFEKMDGNLNHLAAVKEHTRSAADQDIPLSHEMRPPSVLSKTMDFLLCNIVDRIDNMVGTMKDWFEFIDKLSMENLRPSDPMSQFYVTNPNSMSETVAEWFEFMWSVTRAVRKDITQQNLKDLVSLSIVEKCARFHIFCAERLCEETPHDFDRKLNDENLTKCLQTLKHTYYDLSLEGVGCPQEEEFRAYDVLLNLNQGDTLREVQTLPNILRTGARVQFALKCFNALNNNNFVKFFKLVRQASFLEGCILQRYFYQVRRRAVETIQRAFTPGKGVVNFPTQKLVDMLGFESVVECGRFLRVHGVEYEEDTVFLERGTFYYPDTQPPLTRSVILIESKKTVSYGEVVNGGPLGENPYLEYFPHDSFDENGYLKKEAYDAKDQEVTISPEELEEMKRAEEEKEQLAGTAREIVEDYVEEVCHEQGQKVVGEVLLVSRNKEMASELAMDFEQEVLEDMLDKVASQTLRSARNKLLQIKMLEEQRREEQETTAKEVVDDLILEEIEELSKEEMRVVQRSRELERYLGVSEKVVEDLLMETVACDVDDVARNTMEAAFREQEEKVRIFSSSVKMKKMRRVFNEWRRLVSKASRQKAAVNNFPAGPSHLTDEEQNVRLGWGEGNRIQSHSSLATAVRRTEELDSLFRLIDLEDSVSQVAVLEPFQLLDWFQNHLDKLERYPLTIRWKLILSLPSIGEKNENSYSRPFLEMIRRKFRKCLPGAGGDVDDPDLLVCQTRPLQGVSLSVCVRETGQEALKEITFSEDARRKVFSGTSAVMFVYLEEEESLEDAIQRLDSLLVNRPRIPPVPLAVLSTLELSEVGRMFNLVNYVSEGVISCYDVYSITTDIFDISQIVQINNSVRQLVEKIPEDPIKLMGQKPFKDFIEDFLASTIFLEFFSNLKSRRSQDLLDREPNDLIALYNCGLDHLACVAKDLDLQEISWPVQEFSHLGQDTEIPSDWNTSFYIDPLVELIESLKLPELLVFPTASWRDLVEQVMVYLDKVAGPNVDSSVAGSAVSRALARSYRAFLARVTSKGGEGEGTVPPPECLPWTDIVHSCVQLKLASLPLEQAGNVVCYKEEALADFSLPGEWTGGLGWGAEHREDTLGGLVEESVCEARERSMVEQGPVVTNPELRDVISKEQRQALRFEKLLEEALSEDYVPDSRGREDTFEPLRNDNTRDKESEKDDEDNCDLDDSELSMEFVPVISYISPSLGQLVSPLNLLTRQEVTSTGMSPRHGKLHSSPQLFSTPHSAVCRSKRKAEVSTISHGSSVKKQASSMCLDQKLEELQANLDLDLEQDRMFERRLQAAMM